MSLSSPAQPSRTRPATLRRRWIPRVLATAAILAGAAVVAPSAAHADTGYGYCQAAACNGKDPVAENCQVNAYQVSSWAATISGYGTYTVELIYSPDCEANWARVLAATAVPFCVNDSLGDIASYTSVPGEVPSWTNMVNGTVHDSAYVFVPDTNEPVIEADDVYPWHSEGANAPAGCNAGS
jgi:hypothetical protein